jgi:Fur family peroxide stress response transcriptional regulator
VATGRRRYNELVRTLMRGGYRLTPQREAVLRVLASAQQHPSAHQVYEQARRHCRSTSLATIYNTVSVLKQLGEVEELEFAGVGHRYAARTSEPHAHLVCTRCGRIDDFETDALRAALATAMVACGHSVTNYRLDFYGECPGCQGGPTDQGAGREDLIPSPDVSCIVGGWSSDWEVSSGGKVVQ